MTSIYQRVTDTLLEHLSNTSADAWVCPWHDIGHGLPTNLSSGRNYKGINILTLWSAAQRAGLGDNRWASYRQWAALGAQVRRGERGSLVIFYQEGSSQGANRERDGDSPSRTGRRFLVRTSIVFNAAQVDGAPAGSIPRPAQTWSASEFDDFLAKTGATIRIGGGRAYYVPTLDEIHIPRPDQFRSREGYTATLAHELIHWTGAKGRLSRDLSGRFGARAYAAEELIAELGSAFVLAGLGLAPIPHPNHAAYIASWLPLLRDDPRAIFVAASQASKAADWLLGEVKRQSDISTTTASDAGDGQGSGHDLVRTVLEATT